MVKKHSKVILLNVLLILFFWLIAGNFKLKAQQIVQKINFNHEEITSFNIKEFSVKNINQVNYVRFLILENQNESHYILESSEDGENFIPLEMKDGFKSPNSSPLLYCFNEEETNIEKKYRIKRVNNTEVSYSNIITVSPSENKFLAQSN
jgi:hypothetical protein